jgi:hypothetical protein
MRVDVDALLSVAQSLNWNGDIASKRQTATG